jgi:high-affinity iron transporter
MNLKPLLTPVLVATAFGFAACGGDDDSESAGSTSAPSGAAELDATREGLQQARTTYRQGDTAAADEQVSSAYVDHFEQVEGPLEEKDHELNEQLEDTIREDLRAAIKSGDKAQVEKLFREIFADMEKAEALLQ